jgi:hypothetical protein
MASAYKFRPTSKVAVIFPAVCVLPPGRNFELPFECRKPISILLRAENQ